MHLGLQVIHSSSQHVARSLGLTPRCLSLLTGTVYFNAGDKRFNLGLAIKDVPNQMCVLEYAKQQPDQRGWLYSDRTMQTLKAYKVKFSLFYKLFRITRHCARPQKDNGVECI